MRSHLVRDVLVAVAAALALADASVVTLALPPVIAEFDTSVEGAAAVIAVYTGVLAAVAWAVTRRAPGGMPRWAGPGGFAIFAAACVGCGVAGSLGVLVGFRGLQAAGAGLALVAAFAALRHRPHWWGAAATLGIAAGPALGGLLTQALDWRAIFLVQAPVVVAAAVALAREAVPPEPAGAAGVTPADRSALAALALVAAALTAVLFLLVLLLVSGWSLSPLAAAATVTTLPVAAAIAARATHATPLHRAATGAALIGAGTLTLAVVPGESILVAVVAQAAAGAGMGLALPALQGHLIPERTRADAARLLAVRHAGITVALALLAPVAHLQLDAAIRDAREKGAALVLDARLPPLDKIGLAGALVADVDPVDPRGQLRSALDRNASRFAGDAGERAAYERLRRRADETLVAAVGRAFALAFLLAGALAIAAAVLLRAPPVAAAALLLPLALLLARPALAPDPVRIADPCAERALPGTDGFTGALQDAALVALDRAACRLGSSREELAIALADGDAAEDFEREHGADPRSATELLRAITGL